MSSLRTSRVTAAAALGLTSVASQQAPKFPPASEKPLITINALVKVDALIHVPGDSKDGVERIHHAANYNRNSDFVAR